MRLPSLSTIKAWLIAKRPTWRDVRAFFLMFVAQLFLYFLFSVNARALAQGRVAWTFNSDLVYAAVSYHLLRRVTKNSNGWGQVGYVLGGANGSIGAIYLTRWLFGQ